MPDHDPIEYFARPKDFRDWLKKNHLSRTVLWVGYYKKASGLPSITWEESVDEALCFGWIDGLRKSVDEKRYRIRFTPRRPKSNWSAVNIRRVGELKKQGRMQKQGLAVFSARDHGATAKSVSKEQCAQLDEKYVDLIKKDALAWTYFQQLAPSYKRNSIRWVMSAKREDTRMRRLDILIRSSKNGEKIPPLQR